MNQREVGFTQGVGWSVMYMLRNCSEDTYAEFLAKESGIPLKNFEEVCDEYDLEYIRKVFK